VAGRSGDARLPWRRRAGPVVAALVAVTMVGLVVGGIRERPSPADLSAGAKATRLASVTSNRYEYWHVGLRAFAEHPVAGLGSGGFRVEWLKRRTIEETVRDVHSLELEMAAELGLVGLLAFATMIAGVLLCARTALRRAPVLAAGWAVTALAWLLHASIDWDWQLPAVSLPAVLLAGALIALAESEEPHAGAETPAVGRAAPGALSVR
jgi:O-antigen ligase